MTDFKGSLGKNYVGTNAGGQGPILGMDSVTEPEPKGPFGGKVASLSVQHGGVQHDSYDGTEEKGFDIKGSGYTGPQNFSPTSAGENHNYNINHETKGFMNKGK